MPKELVIKTMSREEVDFAVELAAKEGWNPGLYDGDCFYQADPEGFLIGYVDSVPVGCISAVSYQNSFGFIGFYIVVPEYRGQGYGMQLWNAAMKRLRNHNVGLDGVMEQQENYKKSGFRLAYSNIRFEGPALTTISLDKAVLVDLQEIPFEWLEKVDRQCFPAIRRGFLKSWITRPKTHGIGYLNNQELGGYGVIRTCRQGYKVGPLFAESRDKAEAIYLKLSSYVEGNGTIYLDIPEVNQTALKMAEQLGMKKVFGTARMYNGPEPEITLEKVFGVTTFELG
ncbi:MAG: GNAT family N-acetyltransferase [Desulfobacca sp.]|nr:GNAT family N-acetyltransferase [Desulfobacca sp.]